MTQLNEFDSFIDQLRNEKLFTFDYNDLKIHHVFEKHCIAIKDSLIKLVKTYRIFNEKSN